MWQWLVRIHITVTHCHFCNSTAIVTTDVPELNLISPSIRQTGIKVYYAHQSDVLFQIVRCSGYIGSQKETSRHRRLLLNTHANTWRIFWSDHSKYAKYPQSWNGVVSTTHWVVREEQQCSGCVCVRRSIHRWVKGSAKHKRRALSFLPRRVITVTARFSTAFPGTISSPWLSLFREHASNIY
jgi:predicted Fe-S protein YdhL (DUF1289 family)